MIVVLDYRTRNGSIWRDTSILRILDESSAKGVYVFNTMRQTDSWKTELKPESEWGKADCEPIVSEVDLLKVNKLSTDDVVHESATLHERWPSMAPDDKRKVVEALIEKITIGDGEIDITYSSLPTSEELCKNQQGLGSG